MATSWKKLENESGFPYYWNESTQEKQWDHPKFIEIKNSLDEQNFVKYSKYRLALKFRTLQKQFFMEEVSLNTILAVFDKHKLGINEGSLRLDSYDLEAVLMDIYFITLRQKNNDFDLDFAVELMQNFLYNIYDKNRQAKIQVCSIKLVLALLSNCTLPELYNLLFMLCADHNNCVTRLRLQSILVQLVEVFAFMHEDVSFGHHLINSTIESCFSHSPGLVGLSENSFISWLDESTHILSWIPILFRVRTTELVVHDIKCSTCKTYPLQGLLYKCIKCIKYIQCQQCFLMGRINYSHKLSHSMREFSETQNNIKNNSFKFIKKLRELVPCSRRLQETENVLDSDDSKDYLCLSSESAYLNETESSDPLQAQLQLIIRQLEIQNRDIQKLLFGGFNEEEVKKHLEQHRIDITQQIQKLKLLKGSLSAVSLSPKNIIGSTPISLKFSRPVNVENNFSPITQILEYSNDKTTKQNNLSSIDENCQELTSYSMNDISTWIKDHATTSCAKADFVTKKSPVAELHTDLDEALTKLQQILANNFTLDESLGTFDNDNLKHAVSEMEGMITSFIDNVETRATSLQRCLH